MVSPEWASGHAAQQAALLAGGLALADEA